jgi:hypothetical protein
VFPEKIKRADRIKRQTRVGKEQRGMKKLKRMKLRMMKTKSMVGLQGNPLNICKMLT